MQRVNTISERYSGVTELSEVARTVEMVIGEKRYRIEINKYYDKQSEYYDVRCWRFEYISAQRWHPRGNGLNSRPVKTEILVAEDVPHLAEASADTALNHTVNYLVTGRL